MGLFLKATPLFLEPLTSCLCTLGGLQMGAKVPTERSQHQARYRASRLFHFDLTVSCPTHGEVLFNTDRHPGDRVHILLLHECPSRLLTWALPEHPPPRRAHRKVLCQVCSQ